MVGNRNSIGRAIGSVRNKRDRVENVKVTLNVQIVGQAVFHSMRIVPRGCVLCQKTGASVNVTRPKSSAYG